MERLALGRSLDKEGFIAAGKKFKLSGFSSRWLWEPVKFSSVRLCFLNKVDQLDIEKEVVWEGGCLNLGNIELPDSAKDPRDISGNGF